jgi:hypothetical protein
MFEKEIIRNSKLAEPAGLTSGVRPGDLLQRLGGRSGAGAD